jgi:DNA polymerase-3 subunit alpha
MTKFIHLRLLSLYSLLESTLKIEKIIELAQKYKMPALAVTDKNNLFGALEFSLYAQKNGIQPINGVVLDIKVENHGKEIYGEILILAKDQVGFQNLLKLCSAIYTKNDRSVKESISLDDLEKYSNGLIVLSGYDQGIIGKLLLQKKFDEAENFSTKLKSIFENCFYFEISRHGTNSEKLIEVDYVELAHKLDIPLVATNRVMFDDISTHPAHDVLRCIAEGTTIENTDRNRASNQCFFKSQEEMVKLFQDLPSSLENTVNIARRCSVFAERSSPILPSFTDNPESEKQLLKDLAKDGLKNRLEKKFTNENISKEDIENITKLYNDRIDYELEIICDMNFSGYFLIVSDFIKWAKKENITVGPGRGSGAGSIVAWSLLITDVDPIRFGLLFERFLNPKRVSMPDFDIDFCQERREEVIEYVRNKYGHQRVGNIITFGKLQAKAAIKDVARVLGMRFDLANYITDLVPFNAVTPVTLSQALKEIPELAYAYLGKGLFKIDGDKNLIKQVLDTALALEGLCRHVSVHAAGIVIAGKDLVEIVPLYKDQNSDSLIIQYSMKMAEEAGLVKFDFLGLQTLTVISQCKQELSKSGIEVDFEKIDFNDNPTYEMLSTGNSTGVFQFESIGMRDSLRKLKPDNINDIVALGALYRPGPMENIPIYISCKHGYMKPDYIHSLLINILKETYGVIVYQEQVMEIARTLAGYTLGASDLLRRAMGKKNKDEMNAQQRIFIEGTKENKIKENDAIKIFESVAKFAGYGFNKSHAVSYGIISFQTAYLKANYPLEFFVTYMNLEINDSDKIYVLLGDAKNSNIQIVPPDINKSEGGFIFDRGANSIIYALGAIKGITRLIGDQISEERKKNGPYRSIIDFMERNISINLNKRAIEHLIKAGSFDLLHENRNSLLNSLPRLISHSNSANQDRLQNQFSFQVVNTDDIIVDSEKPSHIEKAMYEMEVTGLFLSSHPLSLYEAYIKQGQIVLSDKLKTDLIIGNSKVRLFGVIHKKDTRMSGNRRFTILSLSDYKGFYELTIFNDEVIKSYGHLTNVGQIVCVTCDASNDGVNSRLTALKFEDIKYILNPQNDLVININNEYILDNILGILYNLRSEEGTFVKIKYSYKKLFLVCLNLNEKFNLSIEDLAKLKKFSVKIDSEIDGG